MTFTHVYRPASDEPEHSEPHFNAVDLCVCSCGLCTLRVAGGCVCLDCPCDGEGDRDAEHTPLVRGGGKTVRGEVISERAMIEQGNL